MRVLAVISTDLRRSGATLFLMRCFANMRQEDAVIDIWTPGVICGDIDPSWFAERGIRVIEGNILVRSNDITKRVRCRAALRDVLRSESYDVVHVNTGAAWLQKIALGEAARQGVPRRIAHSHCSGSRTLARRIVQAVESIGVTRHATQVTACSVEAGEFLFGRHEWSRRGVLVVNGIEMERYRFSPETRTAIRREMGLDDGEIVIACVGRLSKIKNQALLVRVLPLLCKTLPSVQLWLVGDGELREDLKNEAAELGVGEYVRFFGSVDNVASLLQAADVLAIPSLNEGFSFVSLEGQAAGLPCVISSGLPESVVIDGCNVRRLDKGAADEVWVKALVEASNDIRDPSAWMAVKRAGFDARNTADAVLALYRCQQIERYDQHEC